MDMIYLRELDMRGLLTETCPCVVPVSDSLSRNLLQVFSFRRQFENHTNLSNPKRTPTREGYYTFIGNTKKVNVVVSGYHFKFTFHKHAQDFARFQDFLKPLSLPSFLERSKAVVNGRKK